MKRKNKKLITEPARLENLAGYAQHMDTEEITEIRLALQKTKRGKNDKYS